VDEMNVKVGSYSKFPTWSARGDNSVADEISVGEVWRELKSSCRSNQIDFLVDTRKIHHRLFQCRVPVDFEVYAGHYRGEDYPALAMRRASITYHRPLTGLDKYVSFIEPQFVAPEMATLGEKIALINFDEEDSVVYFYNIVSIFRRYSAIHPYVNGNGRISRLVLGLLAHMNNINVSPEWTFHIRPYGHVIGLCFQEYRTHPHFLTAYLSRWFG
jgi:fido (protein-threonine AMPylation protein)